VQATPTPAGRDPYDALPSPLAKDEADRARFLGLEVDRLDMEATLARCERLIESGGPAQHVVVNAAKLVAMRRDGRLGDIVRRCAVVNADGQPIVWASRLLGDPLPERVTGCDLMERLLGRAEERGWRVYFLGAREDVLACALDRLRERFPHLIVCGSHHGYFDEAQEGDAICADIGDARPHLLFVAISSPKKEYWLAEHLTELDVPFGMGVGGSIDVVAGLVRRAPRWMQAAGLEWLFRLVQEPRRLARRYLISNAAFLILLTGELIRCRVARRPA
jgi:N-acetylglucosaminyldiphosphoundecaprenol N-acetyl-beta-D-mannosaminyltransferase